MKDMWRATATATFLLFSSLSLFTPAFADPSPSPDSGKDDDAKPPETFKPCQLRSPNTGSFFDINPLRIVLPTEEEKDKKSFYNGWFEEARNVSWHTRGYDYPANFTINFCGPVVEELKNVVDVERSLWQNISAFYIMDDKMYSIGQQNDDPVFRGRKLTLNYTNGSPCPEPRESKGDLQSRQSRHLRRKSTLITMNCERDLAAPKLTLSFIGTTDECSYFFEGRSNAFCPAVNTEKQQVGPSGVFGLIFFIAALVYVVGGVVYQRAVLHQRGWRQLPNYTLWASIASVIGDILSAFFSTCLQCFGVNRRKTTGYGQVPNGSSGYANGVLSSPFSSPTTGRRVRGQDDETVLIDQLDEVWDD